MKLQTGNVSAPKGAAAPHVPARHGRDDRAAVARCDGAGVRRRPRAVDAAARLRLRRQRHRAQDVQADGHRHCVRILARACGRSRRCAITSRSSAASTTRRPTTSATAPAIIRAPRPPGSRACMRTTARGPASRSSSRRRPTSSQPTCLGADTPVRSLELAVDTATQSACDSGDCFYVNTVSWRNETTPNLTENHPRVVFERLFGDGGTGAERTVRTQQDGEHSRLRARRGESPRRVRRSQRSQQARPSTWTRCARSSSASARRRTNRTATSSCRSARSAFPRRSTTTRS